MGQALLVDEEHPLGSAGPRKCLRFLVFEVKSALWDPHQEGNIVIADSEAGDAMS